MKLISIFGLLLILSGCGESPLDSGDPTPVFTLQCDLTSVYTPSVAPVVTRTGSASVTVVLLHGKSGSPLNQHIAGLQSDLNSQGYDVVAPYMPWSGSNWTGTLCDSISYINELIHNERQSTGNYIVLVGHSLAGPVSLAYAALADTEKPDALSVVAPGHIPHQSTVMAQAHADSLVLAKNMVFNGQSNQLATFQTLNQGIVYDISTTPTIYLSMHDPEQFPNILASIPLVQTRTLWLAGQDDALTTSMKNLGITGAIPAGDMFTYKEVSGDHFTVLQSVPAELNLFF